MSGLQKTLPELECAQNVKVLTGTQKKCTKCGEIKLNNEFNKYKVCNKCRSKYKNDWRNKNPDKVRAAKRRYLDKHQDVASKGAMVTYHKKPEQYRALSRKWRNKNKDKVALCNKKYRVKNKNIIKEKLKVYYSNHSTLIRKRSKLWYINNTEQANSNSKKWASSNPERIKEMAKKNGKKRYATLRGRLNSRIRFAIRRSLVGGKNGRSWVVLVGWNIDILKIHLEKQFKSGMSWDNYGKWHIDHIIPISAFNFETPDDMDFKKCWALKNLQPLWASDNIRKSNKLEKPFQPSLAIGR